MWVTTAILGLVTLERIAELAWAARNTRALLARGAVEVGRRHYPLIVCLHAAWLGSLWILAWGERVNWIALTVFILLQAGRAWVLVALGSRWTTRVLIMPGETPVAGGPYRWFRHPNYLVVVGEIAILPLAFGLLGHAALFTLLNAGVLLLRVRTEDAAWRAARASPA